MKFSIHKSARGLTVPVSGTAGNMILKLPDGRPGFQGVPEAEFAAMTLAGAVGIQIPQVQLLSAREVKGLGEWAEVSNRLSFAVARFDRSEDGRRVHAEEFAQILDIPPARERSKYDYTILKRLLTLPQG
jgi:serine/threonine-protein kinase HipA